jgi:hypothetical protein
MMGSIPYRFQRGFVQPGWYNFSVNNPPLRIVTVIFPLVVGIFFAVYGYIQYSRPQVVVEWETASEVDTIGFIIYRSVEEDGPFELITSDMIIASGDALAGGSYDFPDKTVLANKQYYYRLVEIDKNGIEVILGETSVFASRHGVVEVFSGLVCIMFSVIMFIRMKPWKNEL